jgi:ATP-dependent DNA helicase RecG
MPRRYEDRRSFRPIGRLRLDEAVNIRARVQAVGMGRTRRGLPYCEILVEDGTGTLPVRWYRQAYLARLFRRGQTVVLSGRLAPHPPRQMVNPEHEIEEAEDAQVHTGRIVPIYPLTQGLSQRFLRRVLFEVVRDRAAQVADPLPEKLRAAHRLLDRAAALQAVHAPAELAQAVAGRRRLAFDEFFLFSLVMLRERRTRAARPGIAFTVPGALARAVEAGLPFALTPGQQAALQAIRGDMGSPRPMQRLLQGDVGSGKTIVSLLAALDAIGNGYQAALMAPTEILAAQHAERAAALCQAHGVPVLHLAGGTSGADRQAALAVLASGAPCLAVGTHALLTEDVRFGRLGFLVVDEQHRFGVLQRAALQAKGTHPDVLVMSATPIPRSLALVLYGDLDLATIPDLPPGRRPIVTSWMEEAGRSAVQAEMAARLAQGERVFVVCPVVEESAAELTAAVQTAARYHKSPLARWGVGLVHGRLPAAEKLATITAFREGRVGLLVATTVVEVGVDVPEATFMVIEHADRLGLAQLHQLRGRIGRSSRPARCVVMAERDEIGPEAQARLEAFIKERDGFALAEADLRLRGPGEFFGTRQAGLDEFQVGDLTVDLRVLEEARAAAEAVLSSAPDLDGVWAGLREEVARRWAGRLALARVG